MFTYQYFRVIKAVNKQREHLIRVFNFLQNEKQTPK